MNHSRTPPCDGRLLFKLEGTWRGGDSTDFSPLKSRPLQTVVSLYEVIGHLSILFDVQYTIKTSKPHLNTERKDEFVYFPFYLLIFTTLNITNVT